MCSFAVVFWNDSEDDINEDLTMVTVGVSPRLSVIVSELKPQDIICVGFGCSMVVHTMYDLAGEFKPNSILLICPPAKLLYGSLAGVSFSISTKRPAQVCSEINNYSTFVSCN